MDHPRNPPTPFPPSRGERGAPTRDRWVHLPILRGGEPYASVERSALTHVATGEPLAEVSRANPGLVGHDLRRAAERRRALDRVPAAELAAVCRRAAELFASGELPAGEERHSPETYVRLLSATSGLPETLCRANMAKIEGVLARIDTVVGGLTRGLPPETLDRGVAVDAEGRVAAFRRECDVLGVVLPSNSPGVHSLWVPAIALKTPLALKPGSREPWTPYRIVQALLAAGCPPEALSFYPGEHAVGGEILLGCERSMLFGDEGTLRTWAADPRVQLHGPGWSKVVVGADRLAGGEVDTEALDAIVESVAANGGRSCVNASGVWLPAEAGAAADRLAEALAERLAAIPARPLDHPEAALAAFPDPRVAQRISDWIDVRLRAGGAEDLTAKLRPGGRLAEAGGCTFLLPTVVRCGPEHPLARAELLFPFVTVVAAPRAELVARMGSTLVATALTGDRELIAELAASRGVDRLNVGAIPTSRVVWDQPHEGNLFEHLYHRRAFQSAAPLVAEPAPREAAA